MIVSDENVERNLGSGRVEKMTVEGPFWFIYLLFIGVSLSTKNIIQCSSISNIQSQSSPESNINFPIMKFQNHSPVNINTISDFDFIEFWIEYLRIIFNSEKGIQKLELDNTLFFQ